MIKTISYKDKTAIQNDISIPDENKVTDHDMNEIKEAVNYNAKELENTKNKVNDFENYDDTLVKQEIEKIKNKNEIQDKNIENLQQKNIQLQEELEQTKTNLENYAIHGKESGEYIHLTDSSETDCRVDVRGNSRQETSTQGKNRIDLREATYKVSDVNVTKKGSTLTLNGIMNVPGNLLNTVGDKYSFIYLGKFKAGTYRFSRFIVSGKYSIDKNIGAGTFACYIKKKDETTLGTIPENASSGDGRNIILQEDTDLYMQIFCNKGAIFDNYVLGFQLEEGDTTTDLEQFTPNMPSLDYPSKIETVKGSVKVTSSSANTLDLTKLQTINVTECTVNEKSKNQITLTTTQNEGASYIRFKMHLKKGIWYFKRKFELIEGKGTAITGKVTAQTLDWKWIFQLEKNIEKVQFELKEDTDFYLAFNIKSSLDTNIEKLKIRYYDIMLSNYDVNYVQNKEDSVVLPVQEEMCALKVHENNQNYNYIAKDGTKYICDEIIKKNNKYYYRKWIDSLDTTSAKSAMVRTATNNVSINYFVEDLLHSAWNVMTSFAMCNKFKQCTPSLIDKENSFAIWNGNKNIAITIDNSCLEDVSTNEKALESWNKLIKKWEAEGTALKLIYCRENPKDIEITSLDTIQALEKLDKLKTYKNITNITTDSIAILDVDYKKDLETLLNQVSQALVEGS